MSELNGSGGNRGVPDAAAPWPAMGRDPGRPHEAAPPALPAAQQPIQMAKPGQGGGRHGQTGEMVRPDAEQPEAQPWDIVERLRQMADLIGDALAAGERKVSEAQTETAAQV
ncbi:hypothetical protein ACFYYL_06875, partial [Actinomadura geliboluensis]